MKCYTLNFLTCPQDILECVLLVPVVHRMDSTRQWVNHYPLNNAIDFDSTSPLDSDLFS